MSSSAGTHLTTEQVAAYLERSLSGQAKLEIERHLADCEACRHEASQAWRLIAARRRRGRVLIAAPIAAAAAAAILLFAGPLGEPGNAGSGPLRTDPPGGREAVDTFGVRAPSPGSDVQATRVRFEWEELGADATYALTLTRESGRALWSLTTDVTSAVLPDSVQLDPGALYFWYVDALQADGRSATTGVQSFTTSR